MTPDTPLDVGDYVRTVSGDFAFAGYVVAAFTKLSGTPRYVVEDDRGVLLVFARQSLEPELSPAEVARLEILHTELSGERSSSSDETAWEDFWDGWAEAVFPPPTAEPPC